MGIIEACLETLPLVDSMFNVLRFIIEPFMIREHGFLSLDTAGARTASFGVAVHFFGGMGDVIISTSKRYGKSNQLVS